MKSKASDSCDWFKSIKEAREATIYGQGLSFISFLPKTVRIINNCWNSNFESINCLTLKGKFPFLIKLEAKIPIKAAQTLNLRSIWPIMSETEEKFTLRPREIRIDSENVVQLNNHSELFERVEKVVIETDKFNFDCLSAGIKEIRFNNFVIEGEKLESLEKNNWKFEQSVVDIRCIRDKNCNKQILNSFGKARKVKIVNVLENLIEDYPQFRFDILLE